MNRVILADCAVRFWVGALLWFRKLRRNWIGFGVRTIDRNHRILRNITVLFFLLSFPFSVFIYGHSRNIAFAAQGLTTFDFKKDLVFNTSSSGADVSTGQTDFPICVNINSSSWPNATERAHFFAPWNTDGKRAQFFDSDGTTNLSYEVEYYSQADQEAVYWVKVPQVDGDSTTDKVTVAYGNDPNGVDQDIVSGVWDSNFSAVYHLGDNGWTSGNTANRDSTTNLNHSSTVVGTSDGIGSVGKSRDFDAVDDYIEMNDSDSLSLGGVGNFCGSCWVRFDSTDRQVLFAKGAGNANQQEYQIEYRDGGDIWWFYDTGSLESVTGPNSPTTGVWHYLSFWRDGTNLGLSFDGVSYTNPHYGVTSSDTGYKLVLGKHGEYPGVFLNGGLDEVRLSKSTSRSVDWFKLEYYSMQKTNFNGDSWLSWGSEVNLTSGDNPSGQLPYTGN
jgi:hypothetical protein